jgi:hypothetical protein
MISPRAAIACALAASGAIATDWNAAGVREALGVATERAVGLASEPGARASVQSSRMPSHTWA